jgi:hypothetical protein
MELRDHYKGNLRKDVRDLRSAASYRWQFETDCSMSMRSLDSFLGEGRCDAILALESMDLPVFIEIGHEI